MSKDQWCAQIERLAEQYINGELGEYEYEEELRDMGLCQRDIETEVACSRECKQ